LDAHHVEGARLTTTTPRRLWYFLFGIWAASALMLGASETTLMRTRTAIDTIGRGAAPGIVAAQEVAATLANLDANEADYLLLDDRVAADAATQLFEFRNAQATKRLVDAGKNAAFGDEEKIPIVLMFENLGRYAELASKARYLHDHGDAKGALETYLIATDVMHGRVLRDADALDAANAALMENVYKDEQSSSAGAEKLAVGGGFLLVGALVVAQLFLLRRTRRIINIPLAIATILALGCTLELRQRLVDTREDLREAKEEAFESIHALWQARAIAYDANGDESRYLLDRDNAAGWESAFKTKVAKLTSAPASPAPPRHAAVTGLFGQELDANVSWNGEHDAVVVMVNQFSAFYGVDTKVRALAQASQTKDALALCLSDGSVAYDRFDESVARTLRIDEAVFAQLIEQGDHRLAIASYFVPAFVVVIVMLAWIGVRMRLREYA
jgi:hypothetical protein